MKRIATIITLGLTALALPAHAITVDIDDITPTLTFPQPDSKPVSRDTASLDR